MPTPTAAARRLALIRDQPRHLALPLLLCFGLSGWLASGLLPWELMAEAELASSSSQELPWLLRSLPERGQATIPEPEGTHIRPLEKELGSQPAQDDPGLLPAPLQLAKQHSFTERHAEVGYLCDGGRQHVPPARGPPPSQSPH